MATAEPTLVPPEVIAGRYKIGARLGHGGMGSVWTATHLSLQSPVAVKLMAPSLASSEDAMSRFQREARAAAALRSPHVVQILDHGVDRGVPYIVMELLEGETLAERLTRVRTLSPTETARILTHVARAMSRAHEAGIVHRDLKPDNVFLVRNDDEEIAKVLDFGVAKVTMNTDLWTDTRTGTMLGTPYYMSPEQVEGNRGVDRRSDLWAMAVIAFECLTGVRPFQGDTLGSLLLQICSRPIVVPSQVAPVPSGFDAWFACGVHRDRNRRFQSARQLVDELRAVLLPHGTVAAPSRLEVSEPPCEARTGSDSPEVQVRPSSPTAARRAGPGAFAGAFLLLILLAAGVWWFIRPEIAGRESAGAPNSRVHVVRPRAGTPIAAQPADRTTTAEEADFDTAAAPSMPASPVPTGSETDPKTAVVHARADAPAARAPSTQGDKRGEEPTIVHPRRKPHRASARPVLPHEPSSSPPADLGF